MNKEQMQQIFIEEATEITEALSIDIITFEKDPSNQELLHNLFRGVHTLKGSANSFGFVKIGSVVHNFEDILAYFRHSGDLVNSDEVDLFLRTIRLLQELLQHEIEGREETPEHYHTIIHEIATHRGVSSQEGQSTHTQEIEESLDASPKTALYIVELTLEEDSFFRGLDHGIIIKNLAKIATIEGVSWECHKCPDLQDFSLDSPPLMTVKITLSGIENLDEINHQLILLEEGEYRTYPTKVMPTSAGAPQDVKNIAPSMSAPKKEVSKTKNKPQAPSSHVHTTVNSMMKVSSSKLDELLDSLGELLITQNLLAEKSSNDLKNEASLRETVENLSTITQTIQSRVMSLRMVPVNSIFQKMHLVIHDTARALNKKVNFQIEGSDTELDKSMVDLLAEPISHLLRNAIDHGLENTTQERLDQGKPMEGTLTLRAYYRGGNIHIEIEDDGRGLDRESIFKRGLELGIISPEDEHNETLIYSLITRPGFSTKKEVNNISGRGVGLDVVATSVRNLQGSFHISSEANKGTTFTIRLPLTLAIIEGMVVKVSQERFIIPTLSIKEAFIPDESTVFHFKQTNEFVQLNGESIEIIRLNHILGLDDATPPVTSSILLLVEPEDGQHYVLLIDELVGMQQVVIKSLGKTVEKATRYLSGCTIMGDGEVALILNTHEIGTSNSNNSMSYANIEE